MAANPSRFRLRVFAPFRGLPAPGSAGEIAAQVEAERQRARAEGDAVGEADASPGEWAAAVLASENRAGVVFAHTPAACLRGLVLNEIVRRGDRAATPDAVAASWLKRVREAAASGADEERCVYEVIAGLHANRGNAQAIVRWALLERMST